MWPFSAMTYDAAVWWSDFANSALLLSLAIGVIASFVIVQTGNIKEESWGQERARSAERMAGLETEAAIARNDAAQANEAAEREHLERVRLEAKLAPRRLSGEQSSKLAAVLLHDSPLPIAIVSRLLDVESNDFANDLGKAFSDAKWNVVRVGNWTQSFRGVAIAAAADTPVTSDVETLLSAALDAANIPHVTKKLEGADLHTMDPWVQPNVLYLLVGGKP